MITRGSPRDECCRVAMWVRWMARGLACLVLTLAVTWAGPTSIAAQEPNRVGLVVVHEGGVIQKCIAFGEEQISGYDVLERSGLALIPMAGGALGISICSIDHHGCNYPAEDCFCQCQGTPCKYWSYWHLVDGEWQYSSLGAASYWVRDGDVEGWVWGEGEYARSGRQQPPMVHFEDICSATPSGEQPVERAGYADTLPVWWVVAATSLAVGALVGMQLLRHSAGRKG